VFLTMDKDLEELHNLTDTAFHVCPVPFIYFL